MKDFIIIAGMILILMFFPVQYVLNQVNHHDMMVADEIVHRYAQKARTSGYFTPQIINDMRNELATKLRINPGDISIVATTTPKYRLNEFDEREMIAYEVSFPIRRLLAMNQFMGVSDIENNMVYVVKGEVASEVLAP